MLCNSIICVLLWFTKRNNYSIRNYNHYFKCQNVYVKNKMSCFQVLKRNVGLVHTSLSLKHVYCNSNLFWGGLLEALASNCESAIKLWPIEIAHIHCQKSAIFNYVFTLMQANLWCAFYHFNGTKNVRNLRLNFVSVWSLTSDCFE